MHTAQPVVCPSDADLADIAALLNTEVLERRCFGYDRNAPAMRPRTGRPTVPTSTAPPEVP